MSQGFTGGLATRPAATTDSRTVSIARSRQASQAPVRLAWSLSAAKPSTLGLDSNGAQTSAEQVVPLRLRDDEVHEAVMVHGREVAPDVLGRDPPRPGPAAHRGAGTRIRGLPCLREPRKAEGDEVLAEGAGLPHGAVARPDEIVALDLQDHLVVVRPLDGPGDDGAVLCEIDHTALVRVVAPAAVRPVAGTKAQSHGRDVRPEAPHGAESNGSGVRTYVSRRIMVARTRWTDPTAGRACP